MTNDDDKDDDDGDDGGGGGTALPLSFIPVASSGTGRLLFPVIFSVSGCIVRAGLGGMLRYAWAHDDTDDNEKDEDDKEDPVDDDDDDGMALTVARERLYRGFFFRWCATSS
jgi:hypothetical protein